MNLLFQLYRISNNNVKSLIKEYVLQKQFIEVDENKAYFMNLLMLNLSLQLLQIFKISDELIYKVEEYLKKYPSNTFDWHFYQIQKQLNFLLKEDKRFKSCKEMIDGIIEKRQHDFFMPSHL